MRFLPAAIAAFFVLTATAYGQSVDPTVVPVNTIVEVPIGSWIDTARGYLTLALGGIVVWAFRFLPPQLYAIAMTMRADQLMNRALVYAVNAVVGATKDKVWTVDVRNQVLKEIVTFALVHGSAAVKSFIGTPAEIAEKGFARIDAPTADAPLKPAVLPDAPKPDFVVIGAQGQAAATVKGIVS